MTATVEQTARVVAPTRVAVRPFAASLTLVAAAATLVRLPFLGSPVSSDEGGFLVVARQWHSGGGSLYGHYWVDRPPLLMAIFRLADLFGGLTALRLIGCLAASLTVLGVGFTVNRLLGRRSALWAASVAVLLLASPGTGAVIVDGELLAAPFVAGGIAALVVALTTRNRKRATWAAAASGAGALAAVLVKQNMVDVVVFGLVLLVIAIRSGAVSGQRVRRTLAAGLAGAGAVAVLVLGFAAALGTAPGSLFFAMYPFRLRASQVIVERTSAVYQAHALHLARLAMATGAPFLLGLLVVLLLGHRVTSAHPLVVPLAGATVTLAGFDAFSIAAGGSYWSHYLLQLVVPAALATGLVVASTRRLGTLLAALALASSSVAWFGGLTQQTDAVGHTIGSAIGQVADSHDTIVMALGSGDTVFASGLRSPYPYLWSLPSRTLDPQMTLLRATLAGPDAPTWFVVRGPGTAADLDTHGVGAVLRARYRVVGRVCGRDIWLHDHVRRAAPAPAESCTASMAGGWDHLAGTGDLR